MRPLPSTIEIDWALRRRDYRPPNLLAISSPASEGNSFFVRERRERSKASFSRGGGSSVTVASKVPRAATARCQARARPADERTCRRFGTKAAHRHLLRLGRLDGAIREAGSRRSASYSARLPKPLRRGDP